MANKKKKTSSKQQNTKKTVDLEKTNSFDMVFDEDRLTDNELLDVSFVDGKKNRNKIIDEIEAVDYREEAKKLDDIVQKKNTELLYTGLIILFSFILGFLVCYVFCDEGIADTNSREKETLIEKKVVVDDNYVFLGDSIFEFYNLDKFYDGMPIVNSGISGNTTVDILNDLENRVYKYNPSKIVLMIGTNDLVLETSNDEIVENISKIIDKIKKNRKYAEIYVQSIYPVNNGDDEKINHSMVNIRTNENIKYINQKLENLCVEKKIHYMDIYSLLADEEGNLKLEYTTEGLHITDEGYQVITEAVKEILK